MNIKKKTFYSLSWIWLVIIYPTQQTFWYCNWNYPTTYIGSNISVNSSDIIAQSWGWSTNCCAETAWGTITYNLKKDLWLPKFNWTFNSVKDWVYNRWTLKWFWSLFKSNNITYDLYTWNWEKWGVCKPYWLVGDCGYQSGCFERNATPTHLWNLGCKNPWWWADNASLIFWVPFTVINWEVINKLNIVTSNWHLNGSLNETDINFNFSFY